MFNKQILQKIFKSSSIENKEQYTAIDKPKLKIIIHNDKMTLLLKKTSQALFRKNCVIIKDHSRIHIYLHEDYVKYSIRQKLLNKILG